MTGAERIDDFVAAVTGIGADVVDERVGPNSGYDLSITFGGAPARIEIKQAGTVTPAIVNRLVRARERRNETPDAIPVLVGERIFDASRALLRHHGWGWLDLRGHLHLEGPGIFIDAEVQPFISRPRRSNALAGSVGLEVAALLLLHPGERPSVRGIARTLKRSASTVSEVLNGLRDEGILTGSAPPEPRSLFWRLADSWNTATASLAALPMTDSGSVDKALRLGLRDPESTLGWAMTDTMAAALYGAPVGVRTGYPPDFYVPTEAVFSRAIRLLGSAENPSDRKCRIRVAPVLLACDHRIDAAQAHLGDARWPLAHPLFVALDLAADPGRGSEILEGWSPPEPWQRVW